MPSVMHPLLKLTEAAVALIKAAPASYNWIPAFVLLSPTCTHSVEKQPHVTMESTEFQDRCADLLSLALGCAQNSVM